MADDMNIKITAEDDGFTSEANRLIAKNKEIEQSINNINQSYANSDMAMNKYINSTNSLLSVVMRQMEMTDKEKEQMKAMELLYIANKGARDSEVAGLNNYINMRQGLIDMALNEINATKEQRAEYEELSKVFKAAAAEQKALNDLTQQSIANKKEEAKIQKELVEAVTKGTGIGASGFHSGSVSPAINITSNDIVNTSGTTEKINVPKQTHSGGFGLGDLMEDKAFRVFNNTAGRNPVGRVVGNTARDISHIIGLEGLSSELVMVAGGTTLVVGALAAMVVAGNQAYEADLKVTQSLVAMGSAATEVSTKQANEMIDLKNKWSDTGLQLERIFEPIFAGILELGVQLTDMLGIKGYKANNASADAQGAQSIVDFANKVMDMRGTPVSQSIPDMTNTANSAKQSGLSNQSSANMAIDTYSYALKLQEKFGIAASQINKDLADSWLNNSKSAQQYGIVMNDTVLKGWLNQEKGIDAVNVKYSDAQMQAWRLDFMKWQMSAKNQDALQKDIKGLTEYGALLEATKQQLFNFDDVIQLNAIDPTVPDIGSPDTDINKKPDPNPIIPIGGVGNVPDPSKIEPVPPVVGESVDGLTDSLEKAKVKAEAAQAELAQLQQVHAVGVDSEQVQKAQKQLEAAKIEMTELERQIKLQVDDQSITESQTKLNQLNETIAEINKELAKLPGANGYKYGTNEIGEAAQMGMSGLVDKRLTYNYDSSKGFLDNMGGAWNADMAHWGRVFSGDEASKSAQWDATKTYGGKAISTAITALFLRSLGGAGAAGAAETGAMDATFVKEGEAASKAVGYKFSNPQQAGNMFDYGKLKQEATETIGAHHADGGISINEHKAMISEGNNAEAIIPLNNSSANPFYDKISENITNKIGATGGNTYEIHAHLGEGGTVLNGDIGVKKLSKAVYNEIIKLERDQGSATFGRG